VDFGFWVSVSIFPFVVKGVNMVKCPDEIGAGCAAPDCDGMILVGEFVELFVEVGVKMRIGNKNTDGSGQHLDGFKEDFVDMFIHHFFGGFGGVDGEDEQIHYVDGVCVCVSDYCFYILGIKTFQFPKIFL
jgi:hypothetical protein